LDVFSRGAILLATFPGHSWLVGLHFGWHIKLEWVADILPLTKLTWCVHFSNASKSQVCNPVLQKYGPFVRIAPNHVSVSHKDAISVIYGQGPGAFDKSAFYNAFVGEHPSIFSTVDRQDHAQKRRSLSQAFSYRSVVQFEPLLQASLQKFIDKFDKMSQSNDYFDALLWFNYLAFDILSTLAFGEAIGMVENVTFYHVSLRKALMTLLQCRARTLFLWSSPTVLLSRMNTLSNWWTK
jgi:hypothetical protein